MNILFITPYPVSHIRVRSYGFVTHLATQHNVTVLALCAGENDAADMRPLQDKGICIHPIRERPGQQYLRSLMALRTQLPLQVAFGASPLLRAEIEICIASKRFDLVHVEFIRALGALPDTLPLPVVWDAVDCISQLYAQGTASGTTPMLRTIGGIETERVRRYELKQMLRFRHVLVTSERDRQGLLALAGTDQERESLAEVTVLPHGVDTQYFQPYRGPRLPKTLIFSGKMSFHANIAGVMRLVEQVMPHIWARQPDVKLLLAGSNPPSAIRRLMRDARIEVTGYVPDLRPSIEQARVAVCPLPYAVGIQNKILEAMALGTPVVASSHASAGMQAVAGHDLLVADDPEEFASAVLNLLDNQALWNSLSANGQAYIAAHHNWGSILAQLNAVYKRAAGKAYAGK